VSGRKEDVVVMRSYSPDPNSCGRALRLLLESQASKKAAARPGGEDARKEEPNASGNASISR
jgi:hypothetical protein